MEKSLKTQVHSICRTKENLSSPNIKRNNPIKSSIFSSKAYPQVDSNTCKLLLLTYLPSIVILQNSF